MSLTRNEDQVGTGQALLPRQFKEKPNFLKLLRAALTGAQSLEDTLWQLLGERAVDTAIGAQLDLLGKVIDEARNGLGDDDYRVRIKVRIKLNRASGLASDITDVFALILNTDTPPMSLIESFPAGLLVKLNQYVADVTPETLAELLSEARAAAVDTQLWYHPQDEDETFRTSAAAAPVTDSVTGFTSVAALGEAWYDRTFGVSNYVSKVVYGAGVYVAIAGSTLKSSTDLKTWTTRTITGVSGAMYDLIFAGGKFVVICNSTGTTYKSATSTDGISWTLRNSVGTPSAGVGTPSWGAGIAYGSSKYVIMSTVGDISSSSDGETWDFDAAAVGGGDQNFALNYVNNRFMAGTTNGGAFESTTGGLGTWNLTSLAFGTPGGPDDVYGFAYHSGLYIVYGEAGYLYTSSNLTTWTQRTSQFGADTIRNAYSDGTTLVIVGGAGKIASSTNGTAYTARGPIGSAEFRGVVKGGGVWIAAGDDGAIARSTNGTSWADVSFPGLDFGADTQLIQGADRCVDYLDSSFVAWGGTSGSASRLATSTLWTAGGGKLAGVLQA